MKLNWSHWFYTLLKTVIGGAAATGSAWLGTLIGNQVDGAIPVLQFNQLWSVLFSSTLFNLLFFLKQSPLPEDEDKGGNNLFSVLLVLCGFLSFGLMGCSTPQKPPTPTEQKYFEIRTNTVEVVQLVTNVLPATATTVAAVRVEPVTNRVEQYEFVPNANAQLVASTGAAVGNIWGVGGAVGGAILGVFSLWGLFRSRKAAGQCGGTGADRGDGAADSPESAGWGEIRRGVESVDGEASSRNADDCPGSQLVALAVDNDKAKGAAQTIVNLIQAQPK